MPDPTKSLERRLGTGSAAAVVIGMIIGSGIFRVPATVAAETHSWQWSLTIWAIGGAIALAGSLCIAELAAMDPRSGGTYVYIRETYGPLAGFLFGWIDFLIVRPGSVAAVGLIFASYLGTFIPLSDYGQRVVSMILTVLLTAAHYRSVGWGAALQNISSVAKFAALVLMAALIFILGDASGGALHATSAHTTPAMANIGVALIAVMWAYDGWADVSAVAGEVTNPERTLPRAIILGMTGVLVAYVLVNVACFYILPVDVMAKSDLVAADAVAPIFGHAGAAVIAVLVMVSTFGTANATVLTGSRFVYAMSNDGLFFGPLSKVHPRFRTPHLAVLGIGVLGVLYASSRTFDQLTAAIVLGEWPFYILAVAAVMVWRKRAPDRSRPFCVPLYPLLPLLFIAASLGLIINALVTDTRLTLVGFAITVSGLPAWWIWRLRQRTG